MTADIAVNLLLAGWAIGSLFFLILLEAATAVLGVPTISERIQNFSRTATIFVIWACVMIGGLLVHFFEVK